MENTEKLILASESPRRQELLGMLTQDFSVITADVDEDEICRELSSRRQKHEDYDIFAAQMVQDLAAAKAKAVAAILTPLTGRVIIAADTIVTLDQEILGKPSDKNCAKEMLRRLSGRTHKVFTGVHIMSQDRSESFFSMAEVSFYPLDDFTHSCIDHYAAQGSSLDKAGAYGIQDEGAFFVRSIEGDFFTVMGLPIAETARRLHKYLPEIFFFN